MQLNTKDVAAGLLFIAIGAFFALNAWFNLRIGRALNMGPGYFPLLLGVILIGFGGAIAVNAINKPQEVFGKVSIRGIVLVIGAVFVFGLTARKLGLGPSLILTTFMASMSTDRATLISSILLSIGLSIFCVLVFVYALGLPYPVIGPWLGGR